MRRSRAALAITVATGALIAVASPAQAVTGPPTLAASAFLMDGTTGATLANKAGDTKLEGASTTKIMTAYVVLTSPGIDLAKKVTIQQEYLDYVVREGASTAHLKAGATPTVRQLLYGMMLPSGCDAAYALADTFGSGATRQARILDFIAKMNAKAKALGMTNTYYDAFDGISQHGNNKITARDLAKVTMAAMKGTTFKAIVKTTSYSTGGTSTSATWSNTNLMIQPRPGGYAVPGAIGVKTGSGTKAGQCLVFSVTRNGKTIIGVLLNSTDRYPDAIKLTDWALGAPAGAPALQRSTTEHIPDVLD